MGSKYIAFDGYLVLRTALPNPPGKRDLHMIQALDHSACDICYLYGSTSVLADCIHCWLFVTVMASVPNRSLIERMRADTMLSESVFQNRLTFTWCLFLFFHKEKNQHHQQNNIVNCRLQQVPQHPSAKLYLFFSARLILNSKGSRHCPPSMQS